MSEHKHRIGKSDYFDKICLDCGETKFKNKCLKCNCYREMDSFYPSKHDPEICECECHIT